MTSEKLLRIEDLLLYFKDYDGNTVELGLRWPSKTISAAVIKSLIMCQREIKQELCKPQLCKAFCSFFKEMSLLH